MQNIIISELNESADIKLRLAQQSADIIAKVADIMTAALKAGNKILFCGNGGSAADAQHLAAELLGKFKMHRKALPSIALTVNTSAITAIANDYEYDMVFERMIEALGCEGDVLVGISTSGNSKNVARAMDKAREMDIKTVGFVGQNPGTIGERSDLCLCIPSDITPRIQEAHITCGHIICGIIEHNLFGEV
jgi:D-sedoheptulose 7-phosphate isomerase